MSLPSKKVPADFPFKHSGNPDKYGQSLGGDFAQVQTDFDARAIYNQTQINETLDALASTTDGDSGLDNIGMTPIVGYTNPQTMLEHLEADKTPLTGNHLGTWHGYNPVQTDPGIQAIVNTHTRQINDFSISVIDFGAVGDGITDDTIAIQSAIDSLPQSNAMGYGGCIFFPISKGYKITSLNVTGKRGIKFIGDNGVTMRGVDGNRPTSSRIFVTGLTSYGFDLTDSLGISFENLFIEGDTIAPPKTLIFASRSTETKAVNGIRMVNCETAGYVSEYVLCLFNAERNSFIGCVFEGSSPKAIVGLLYSDTDVESPFVGTFNTVVSTTVNNFMQCEFLNYARTGWINTPACVRIQGGYLNSAFRDCYARAQGDVSLKPVVFLIDNANANFNGSLVIENFRHETGGFGGPFIKNVDSTKECNGISIRDCEIKDDSTLGEILFNCITKNIVIENVIIPASSTNKFTFKDVYRGNVSLPISNTLVVTGTIYSSIVWGNANTVSALSGRINTSTVVFSLDQQNFGQVMNIKTGRAAIANGNVLNLGTTIPSSPVQGDVWREAGLLKFYDGSAIRIINLT